MIILLLGPQGSGKGTQAKLLSDSLSYFYLDMGSTLRDMAKSDPLIDETINKNGAMVSSKLAFAVLKKTLGETIDSIPGVVLDGFPRNEEQLTLLNSWLSTFGKRLDLAFFLAIDRVESIRRLSARRICNQCGKIYNLITNPPQDPEKCECGGALEQRPDDTPPAIENRLKVYEETTAPLVKKLDEDGLLTRIDGTKSITDIAEEILAKVNEKGSN